MSTYNKRFLRAASFVCQALAGLAAGSGAIALPRSQWRNVLETARSMEIAHHRGWHYAARCRQKQLLAELEYLQQSLTWLTDQLREAIPQKIVPWQGRSIVICLPWRTHSRMSSATLKST